MLKKVICLIIIFVMVIVMMLAMTACAPKQRGEFCTLQEAYDQGLLTQDDLKNIAYYQNGGSDDENFEPMPKTPESLSDKTEKAIKETRAYDLRNQDTNPIKKAKAKDVTILKYYGTYNNCVAVMITDYYHSYDLMEWDIEIEDVLFHYSNGNRIIIWKEKTK